MKALLPEFDCGSAFAAAIMKMKNSTRRQRHEDVVLQKMTVQEGYEAQMNMSTLSKTSRVDFLGAPAASSG